MDYPKARADLTPEVVVTLAEAMERIGVRSVACQLWETEFSSAEQEQLGRDFPLRRLPEAYAALKKISFERAVLDLVVAADVVTPSRRRLLLNQIGEDATDVSAGTPTLPHFDLSTGRLDLRGGVVVDFKIRKRHTNRYQVLKAFQMAGWAQVIENPLDPALAGTRIHQVLGELNQKVSAIRFSVQASGTNICWAPASK